MQNPAARATSYYDDVTAGTINMQRTHSDLLDELNSALSEALWKSDHVLQTTLALQKVAGDFSLSIDGPISK